MIPVMSLIGSNEEVASSCFIISPSRQCDSSISRAGVWEMSSCEAIHGSLESLAMTSSQSRFNLCISMCTQIANVARNNPTHLSDVAAIDKPLLLSEPLPVLVLAELPPTNSLLKEEGADHEPCELKGT